MLTSSAAATRRGTVASIAVALLLVGASPAHAESVRSSQWHLTAMKAEEMWRYSTGEGVTVAVIDSGVDGANPDLQGQIIQGKDFAPDESGDELTDYDGHGTGMAALIAGTGKSRSGDGAFGLAPGVKILPVRVPDKAPNLEADIKQFNTQVPAAIRYAADQGAKVISISLGTEEGSQKLTDAVKYALGKGSLIFASVGNNAERLNDVRYPAATPGVVGVGALDKDSAKTDESQFGPHVDLAGPGDEMIHACPSETGLCKSHGTSDATAIASASAALIWSKYPDWTNNQVLRVMLNTAGGPTSGAERNDYIGYGAVRPGAALTEPGDPGPADEYPLPDLAAAASQEPSSEPSSATGGSAKSNEPESAAAASDDSGNTALWVGIGIGAAALVGVAVAVVVIRSRRRNAAVPAAPSYQSPYVYQQSQPPYPPYSPPSGAPGPQAPYGGPPHQGGPGPTT
ncbi:type VII secretion-associated serine protease mycosin [Streptomyces sp. NBC_01102]|uniref:type VII secretion-associated serine protease mycosin n=1 Tax=Streptomyces sp. NBC_01102 TaxID=2903749 RepID=UPI00386C8A26|nr:type VII secretion-associated serine protease mycosin [Streptomyces sp. NBC_01102]